MRRLMSWCVGLAVLAGCSSIDCPLNNTVYCTYVLRGDVTTLADTLSVSTITVHGTDTLVLNRMVGTESFKLPMSYARDADQLVFTLSGADGLTVRDTVVVAKTNEPHFESVDCTPNYFHTLLSVTSTHHAIDSITITQSNVSYDTTVENLSVYFKPRR